MDKLEITERKDSLEIKHELNNKNGIIQVLDVIEVYEGLVVKSIEKDKKWHIRKYE